MSRACVLATLGDDPHTQGLFRVARIAHKADLAAHVLPPGSSIEAILDRVKNVDPGWLGFSYRLSPEVAVREFRRCLGTLQAEGLLRHANGLSRRVAVAGLPEAMRGGRADTPGPSLRRLDHAAGCSICCGLATGCSTSSTCRPDNARAILDELRPELFPPRFPRFSINWPAISLPMTLSQRTALAGSHARCSNFLCRANPRNGDAAVANPFRHSRARPSRRPSKASRAGRSPGRRRDLARVIRSVAASLRRTQSHSSAGRTTAACPTARSSTWSNYIRRRGAATSPA